MKEISKQGQKNGIRKKLSVILTAIIFLSVAKVPAFAENGSAAPMWASEAEIYSQLNLEYQTPEFSKDVSGDLGRNIKILPTGYEPQNKNYGKLSIEVINDNEETLSIRLEKMFLNDISVEAPLLEVALEPESTSNFNVNIDTEFLSLVQENRLESVVLTFSINDKAGEKNYFYRDLAFGLEGAGAINSEMKQFMVKLLDEDNLKFYLLGYRCVDGYIYLYSYIENCSDETITILSTGNSCKINGNDTFLSLVYEPNVAMLAMFTNNPITTLNELILNFEIDTLSNIMGGMVQAKDIYLKFDKNGELTHIAGSVTIDDGSYTWKNHFASGNLNLSANYTIPELTAAQGSNVFSDDTEYDAPTLSMLEMDGKTIYKVTFENVLSDRLINALGLEMGRRDFFENGTQFTYINFNRPIENVVIMVLPQTVYFDGYDYSNIKWMGSYKLAGIDYWIGVSEYSFTDGREELISLQAEEPITVEGFATIPMGTPFGDEKYVAEVNFSNAIFGFESIDAALAFISRF